MSEVMSEVVSEIMSECCPTFFRVRVKVNGTSKVDGLLNESGRSSWPKVDGLKSFKVGGSIVLKWTVQKC